MVNYNHLGIWGEGKFQMIIELFKWISKPTREIALRCAAAEINALSSESSQPNLFKDHAIDACSKQFAFASRLPPFGLSCHDRLACMDGPGSKPISAQVAYDRCDARCDV